MAHGVMAHARAQEYMRIPELYKREAWGARKPKTKVSSRVPLVYLVFKKTNTDSCYNKDECMKIIRELQEEDMDVNNLPDIQYNFLIGGDGTMYEGRGWDTAPEPFPLNKMEFTDHINKRSMLIGLITDDEEKRHNQKQEFSVLHLVGLGVTEKKLDEDAQFKMYEELSYKRDPYDDDD